ncbi:MAG: biotin transporter BioY [bacterium]|nr:biotin transporter BioY [bacterium]
MSERNQGTLVLFGEVPWTVAMSSLGTILKLAGVVLATAAAAQVRVWIPGTPVPVTLQTLAVLLAGFALGPRLAPLAMLTYIALGAVGLPFFAVGLLGPTGGYLVGFAVAAAFVGQFGRAGRGSWTRTSAVAAGGTLLIFACGLTWLTVWLNGDVRAALLAGFAPHWVGAILKTGVAVAAVRAWRHSFVERRAG